MGAKRVSVTEMDTWLACRMEYYLKYVRRLRKKEDATAEEGVSPLISGRTIHEAIEAGILSGKGAVVAKEAADTILSALGDQADRYKPGVERALTSVPAFIWKLKLPQSETKFEIPYHGQDCDGTTCGLDCVLIVGKPDVWSMEKRDGIDIITIEEFKTASTDEKDKLDRYQAWATQPNYYAVLLNDWIVSMGKEPPLIYIRFTVLSTRGKPATVGPARLVTGSMLNYWRRHMLATAREVNNAEIIPNYGFNCNWCDVNTICGAQLVGADPESVIAEDYEVKGRS